MGKSIGVTQFLSKRYKTIALPEEWIKVLGMVETGFRIIIWGPSGSGKTTFALKMCKMLSGFGKVYYNSIEQGEGASLQNAIRQVGMEECAGKIVFGDRDSFEEMVEKLKRNKAMFFVIDSAQYANLTQFQYKILNEMFPRKGIVIISWEGSGGHPKGEAAKAIRYMVDVKIHVRNGVAVAQSRYGATHPYRIFESTVTSGQTQLEINS